MKRAIKPIVIRIGNSPSPLAATPTHPASAEQEEPAPMSLGEVMSPLRAMVNTRGARGALAAENLNTAVTTLLDNGQAASYIEFQIGQGDVQIPLGWQLSQTARKELRTQLTLTRPCDIRNGIENGCSVQDVVAELQDQR
jgi:hypothetical protein